MTLAHREPAILIGGQLCQHPRETTHPLQKYSSWMPTAYIQDGSQDSLCLEDSGWGRCVPLLILAFGEHGADQGHCQFLWLERPVGCSSASWGQTKQLLLLICQPSRRKGHSRSCRSLCLREFCLDQRALSSFYALEDKRVSVTSALTKSRR